MVRLADDCDLYREAPKEFHPAAYCISEDPEVKV